MMMAKQAGRSVPYVRFSVRGSESEIATESFGHPSGNLTEPPCTAVAAVAAVATVAAVACFYRAA